MNRRGRHLLVIGALWFVMTVGSLQGQQPQQAQQPPAPPPDLTKGATLYVVPYAHLDTEWRWDYPTTIREYLPKTIRDNFALFEKYPHYIFNFSGANRYRMIKEYYPADYEKVKKYIAAGRWFPSGSSMEENDVNSPSAESVIRQVLYGTQYFKREFGKTSAEYMLPDCFGFPASLPSILNHAGIKYFSTQKLSASWQPAARVGGPGSPEKTPDGIPFNVGVWEGPDGHSIVAALNPGSYSQSVTYDITKTPPPPPAPAAGQQPARPLVDWPARIALNGQVTGLFTDYMYYGTGDTGGTPTEASVRLMEAILTKGRTALPNPFAPRGAAAQQASAQPSPEVQVGDGPVQVVQGTAEEMFLNIKPDQWARLPRYTGDLELINHSAGSITSEAYVKRWNRHNELLADAAEKASVAAAWLGGRTYPMTRLNDAWTLVMGAQFHDIIPGTSIPKAYEYAWNDQNLAMNQFAGVLTSATEAVASSLNTQSAGTPIVVFNPLNISREDVVEASIEFPVGAPAAVRVTGPDGKDVPAQIIASGKVIFLARVPSVGFAVFDVKPSDAPAPAAVPGKARTTAKPGAKKGATPPLSVSDTGLENARYRVAIDQNGDIGSLFDKTLNKELLSAPARLEIKTDNPRNWPAWNMDWEDQMRAPRAYVHGPAKVRIAEDGPVRVALEIARETEGSTFVQTIRLSAGDAGNRVEFATALDWMTKESHLKAVFPLTASNPNATYNWDIGTIARPTNQERQFEVASHQWFDLTDKAGTYGVTVLSDSKIASDKPTDNTLRLTLVRTPGIRGGYDDQSSQDLGHHQFIYGLASHAGDWRRGQTDWQAQRLNAPLLAFATAKHAGALGKTFGLFGVSNSRVRVLAVKKAEQSDEVIVRVVELDGKPAKGVRFTFAAPLAAAREVNGVESPVGDASVVKGDLVTDFTPYQVRSFAVRLGAAPASVAPPSHQAVKLTFDQAVASTDRSVSGGRFDSAGRSLPAEMLPATLPYAGITFALGPANRFNAIGARGQTIQLPAGTFTRVYLLAAADGDQMATFRVGATPIDLTIQDWSGYIGQWDNRIWKSREEPAPPRQGQPAPAPGTPPRMRTVTEYAGLTPGFVKRTPVAWFASHRHASDGSNDAYAYSYLYAYAIDIPAGATTLTLPMNERVKILAVTVSDEGAFARPAAALYDTLQK
ncbi:MAG TPA: glycoside hydrolase family 38 C-terminal domain-containing protein [Vicinamibacterales bacterium]